MIENPDDTKNAMKQDIEEHEKKARSASELQSPKTKKLGDSIIERDPNVAEFEEKGV